MGKHQGNKRTKDNWEVMIDSALYIFSSLLLLKCIWNFGLPFVLARRRLKAGKGARSGISLMISVELLLLFCLVGISIFDSGSRGLFTLKHVFFWGGGLIVMTYLNLFVMSLILGWIFPIKIKDD